MRQTKNQFNRYLQQALSPSTLSAYASDLQHFRAWGGRIPATPQIVAQYLSELAGQLKASTLLRRLAAIRHAHTEAGRSSPTNAAVVQRTLRGIRRVHGSAVKQAQPLTIQMLRKLLRPIADLNPIRDLRDRTLLALGFSGAFRRSELVSLRPCDLQITSQGVLVKVLRSKTDALGKGRVVAIPKGKGSGCPVRLLVRWITVLHSKDPQGYEAPMFRGVSRFGSLTSGLTGAAVGAILRTRLLQCGLQVAGYSAHSLRAGLVTAAALSGAPVWSIQRQTGHRSISSLQRYIRHVDNFQVNAFKVTDRVRRTAKQGLKAASVRIALH